MCITEYDEERTFAEWKEDCIEVEIEKSILSTLADLVKRAGMTVAEFESKTGLKV